jgi:hypothetical protein
MNFLDFYNAHFASITILLVLLFITLIIIGGIILRKMGDRKIRTPWFEIAPDSVKVPESEEMAKTRLLLKRQFEYVEHYIDGVSNVFLALEKEIIRGAMMTIFGDKYNARTHMETCLVNSSTEEIIQMLKNYIESLLVINHIGTDKDKIKRYAKSHVNQVVAIVKKHNYDLFSKLSGNICLDLLIYWRNIGINDPNEWAETHLYQILIGISELRYSDFDELNDNDD